MLPSQSSTVTAGKDSLDQQRSRCDADGLAVASAQNESDSPAAIAGSRIGAILAIVLLAAALWATLAAGWWAVPVWTEAGRTRFLYVLAALAIPTLAAPTRWLPGAALGSAALLIAAGFGWAALVGAAAVLLCALRIGMATQALLQRGTERDGEPAAPQPNAVIELALGLAVIALAVNGLVLLPINSTGLYAVLALTVLATGGRGILERLRAVFFTWQNLLAVPPGRSTLPVRAVLILAGLYIVVASFPEVGHDALSMHLAVPSIIEQEGRWNFDVTRFVWAVMPMNANWLYVAASFLGGENAARLLNLCALLLVSVALAIWTRAQFGRTVALTATLLWLATPLLFALVASAFIDLSLTLLCVAALWAFERAIDTGRRADWAAAAIILGSAVATKLPALLLAPPLAIVGALSLARGPRRPWRAGLATALLAATLAIVFAAPPYLVAALQTGNPVFPFFNAVFRSPQFPTNTSFTNPLFVHALGPALVPQLFLASQRFIESTHSGALGVGLLVALPLALVLAARYRQWRVFAVMFVAATFCVLVFREQVYLRYIVPVLPLLCIAGGWGLVAAAGRGTVLALVLCATVAIGVVRLPVAWWPLPDFPVQAAATAERRDAYLLRVQPEQLAAIAARRLGEGSGKSTALLGVTPAIARATARAVSGTWHSPPLFRAIHADDPGAALRFLYAAGVAWVVLPAAATAVPAIETIRTGSMPTARFGSAELRRLSLDLLPLREVAADPQLHEPARYWGLDARVGGGVEVRLDRPATQRIDLAGRPLLVLEYAYECAQKTDVRSQVNWYNTAGAFLSTSIEVAPCDGSTHLRRSIDVPAQAAHAVVFGTPHGASPAVLRRLSVQAPDLKLGTNLR